MTADFTSLSLVLAANTTYWLVADAAGDSHIAWIENSTDDLGLALRHTGDWTFFDGGATPAYRINATVVPEPSALALAGLACAALALRLRRR